MKGTVSFLKNCTHQFEGKLCILFTARFGYVWKQEMQDPFHTHPQGAEHAEKNHTV
jgi:hypothetical protein